MGSQSRGRLMMNQMQFANLLFYLFFIFVYFLLVSADWDVDNNNVYKHLLERLRVNLNIDLFKASCSKVTQGRSSTSGRSSAPPFHQRSVSLLSVALMSLASYRFFEHGALKVFFIFRRFQGVKSRRHTRPEIGTASFSVVSSLSV